jgi:hypothetical protein
MILSSLSSATRGAFVGIALVVTGYFTYFSVRTARATYYTETQTLHGFERATQIEPENARNWYLLGRYLQYSLEDSDPQRAIRMYQKSIELEHQDTNTWLDLASTYESEGDSTAARNAFLTARKTYPLSAEVSWRYGNFLLRQGELDQAFVEMRRSVEADPMRAAEAFSRSVRVEPDADVILDRVLPRNPAIYLSAMQDLTGDNQTDNALKVWNRLVAMRAKVGVKDVLQLVTTLRQSGKLEEARRVWMQASELSDFPQGNSSQSAVWDGGFESDVTGQGYAWRFSNHLHGVQIEFDNQEKHSGNRSLSVSFDGRLDIAFRDVCQTVPVQPGTAYEFSAWMQARALTTDQGVRMELHPGVPGEARIDMPAIRGTQPWTHFEQTWEGSKEQQEVEICLRRDASDQEDNKIQGTVWVDDVVLTPVTKSGAKP